MTPEVTQAIEEIRAGFPEADVEVTEEADGGAVVFVSPVDPGPQYQQRETWIGFRITFQYPYSDVYPHFVRPDLTRVDGAALGEGTTPTPFEERPAIQISRRSNKLNPETDTALLKLQKVLTWLRSR
ncbi:hypothetical protein AMES_2116 [Amycolatopsis mediterranei S699]|uniref:Uncharacterized protein n=2 Tax=Amycolatopsis mediterranei TaxID=33910 RepID=A0A0H3D175_AMYMU|nr:hypothetical protein [Amycolatopsis mediterranei]ADJ43939.1 conserved hypothetical protein [Amycolatopsis mediterranei U32]AEK40665.1 hypothetical protein RAM_10875 [Amycolatopsis mediterranei S699]AFO75652.1 hypothetical protein AMES_2116 [Amycolatopsis mediterranei S699]AGT82781.1 hypothetical protein B737_2117 [Amycolatopsis mediterranei RB]KDO04262.1 hypothetical protein DV26_44755 [Amycolatopsis mediterranei]